MFCPLCKTEYREGFTRCSDCGLDLVASLDLPEVRENPAILFWIGGEEKVFDLLVAALRDAEIPCAAKSQPRSFLARRLLPDASISVRKSDFDAAQRIAAEAVQHPDRPLLRVQRCPSCEAECLSGITHCQSCGALLLAEEVAEPGLSASSDGLHRALVCPLCGTDFSAEFARCTECGVELISWEESQEPIDSELAEEPLEVIWQGSDPFSVSKVLAELRDEGIVHQVLATHDHLAYELAMPRPRYRVTVFQSDSENAWNRIASIPQSYAFSRSTPEQRSLENEESQIDPGAAPWPARLKKWKPKEATVEIWSGQDTAFARVILNCFAENDLPCRMHEQRPGPVHVFVRPHDADRAREILREITEGTPPS